MKRGFLLWGLMVFGALGVWSQEKPLPVKPAQWDLEGCIGYALTNNIQIQKSRVVLEGSSANVLQAKAQQLPSLSASVNENFTNRPTLLSGSMDEANVFSGNYGVNSTMTLYNGGRLVKNVRQQKLIEEQSKYNVLEAEKGIQLAILESYLRLLYAVDAVKINTATLEVSELQRKRGEGLMLAGSLSKVDMAKLEAQCSTDRYQLTVVENNLSTSKVQLKQLLELGVNEELVVAIPNLDSLDILKPLPALQSVYETTLNAMPRMKSSKLETEIASLETDKTKALYMPKVNLNASSSTGHSSASVLGYNDQMHNAFSNGIGVSVSIPIYTNRSTKTAVQRARLNEQTSVLNLQDTEKGLLKEVELTYQDALSAKSQYLSATEKVKALQTSYDLIDEQYRMGMKNTLELLTEKNNLLSAQLSLLQAKYLTIMNSQLLNLYQDFPLEIK